MANLLKNVAASVALLTLVALIGTLVKSQVWYEFSDDYAQERHRHYQFQCKPKVPTDFEQDSMKIRNRYFIIMEKARIEAEPVDLFGKIRRFLLCSGVGKIGIGALDLSSVPPSTLIPTDINAEEAMVKGGELSALRAEFPQVPEYLFREADCLLRNILVGKENLEDVQCEDVEDRPVAAPVESEEPLSSETPKPKILPWLIVTGADQSNASAMDQVRSVRAALAGTPSVSVNEIDVVIYLIRSWRRTVIQFKTQVDADAALVALEGKLRYGGYVRETKDWCGANPSEVEETVAGVPFWRCRN